MKIAIFVPIKKRSTRIENKNFKKLGSKPLYLWTFDTLNDLRSSYKRYDPDVTIDVYVDSDELELRDICKKYSYNFIERLPELAEDSASGNDLLEYHFNTFNTYDIYCQCYITCPFQSWNSIFNCLRALINDHNYDSSLLSHSRQTWYWYNGFPINYNPKELGRSQDSIPVIQETTGFYAINKSAYNRVRCRIGDYPYFHNVGILESIDLDNPEDFKLAEYLAIKNDEIV